MGFLAHLGLNQDEMDRLEERQKEKESYFILQHMHFLQKKKSLDNICVLPLLYYTINYYGHTRCKKLKALKMTFSVKSNSEENVDCSRLGRTGKRWCILVVCLKCQT